MVGDPSPIVPMKVSAGYRFSWALLENTEVMCWGKRPGVRLESSPESLFSTTPVKMAFQ